MSMVKKSISVTAQQDGWIKAQIETGHYGNESEVVRDLIRERQIREQESPAEIEAIRAALIEGEKSGFSDHSVDQIRNLSKLEALRRTIQVAAMEWDSSNGTTLDALDQLQTSLREHNIDAAQWEQDLKAERQAADQRLSSKSQ